MQVRPSDIGQVSCPDDTHSEVGHLVAVARDYRHLTQAGTGEHTLRLEDQSWAGPGTACRSLHEGGSGACLLA